MAESIQALGGALEYSAISEWDLSAKQYTGVVPSAASDIYVQVASVAGAPIIGVVQNKPTSGRAARVRTHGISKAVAGGAITRGTRVDVGATGYFRSAVGSNYAGYALETVVTSAVFKLLLNPQYTGAA